MSKLLKELVSRALEKALVNALRKSIYVEVDSLEDVDEVVGRLEAEEGEIAHGVRVTRIGDKWGVEITTLKESVRNELNDAADYLNDLSSMLKEISPNLENVKALLDGLFMHLNEAKAGLRTHVERGLGAQAREAWVESGGAKFKSVWDEIKRQLRRKGLADRTVQGYINMIDEVFSEIGALGMPMEEVAPFTFEEASD